VRALKTLHSILAMFGLGMAHHALAQAPDPESVPAPPAPGTVQVWLTTSDASKKLARQADLSWSAGQAAGSTNVTVNEAAKFQQIDGFGASILDSSLWDADPAVREELMRLLFSRSSGIGLSMIRVPMGLSGITGPHRTYNDLPTGQADPTLSQFSIAGDQLWKLPMMRQAKTLNPELTLMGTPWSAPAWMKDSGSLGYGKLKPEYYGVYAQYFVKWLNAWRAEGLGISAVTMQNEPHHEPYSYQGMRIEPAEQAALALQLGPAFKQAGHSTRILCWDHNCDEMSYPIAVMDDTTARNWIHGAAFHAYGGTTSDIYQFTDEHPDKDVHFTEQTGSYPSRGFGGSLAWHLRHIFLVPSLNGARSNLVWQLSRNMENTLAGDRPFVRIAPDGKGYELHGEYYETGHFSKFIRKGARRIETNNSRDSTTRYFSGPLLYAAYQNPDGSKSIVVLNDSGGTQSFTLEDLGVAGRRVSYSMPAGAVATFHWRDAAGGGGLAATYFDNPDLTGLSERRVDPVIDFTWVPETYVSAEFTRPAESPMPSLGPNGFSARWEGQVLPATTETHTFHASTSDGVRLWVNGQIIIDQWVSQAATESSGSISLTANQPATVKMEYFSSASTGGGRAALAWSTPTLAKQIIPRERLYPPVVSTVPPPPLGLTARAPGSGVQLAWAAAPTATSYTVKRATSSAGPFSVLASGLTTTSHADTTAATGTAYTYQVSAVNAQGEGAPSAPRSITPRGSTLTAPWTQQDIGSVGTAGVGGNAGDSGGTVVLGGAGSDIWNSADAFRFAWVPLNGDGSITARVASMEETSPWAKAGLMIRESLAANSAYVNIVVTPVNGVSVQSRASTGAAATGTTVSNLFAPRWLKLTRSGSTFTGYHSMDGVTWTQTAAPVTVAMGANVSIGLALCSGQTSALNLAEFDGISAPGLPLPRPPTPAKPEALAGNSTVNLAWSPAAYATGYEVSRATFSGGPYTPLATVSTTGFADAAATNDTTYYYVIRATNASGGSAPTAEVSATPRSSYLPAGWINRDIGTVGLAGSVSLTAGVYTIQAAGVGVWSAADGFNYSYLSASGDGSMTVRVDSLTNVNYYATKSGLMFRSSAAADAAYAFVAVTPAGEVKFEYRSAAGTSAASQGSLYAGVPRWLRLERAGNILRAFSSANGSAWTQVGGDLNLDFSGDFIAGIAVSANNTTTRTTSGLSQLSVTGFSGPLTPGNLTASAGLDGVRLTWDAVATATGYRVKRMASGESTYTVVGTVSTPGFVDTTVSNRTTYTYVVTALNLEGEGSPANPVSVTTNLAPLPAAWSDSDIGSVGLAGSADHGAGAFTVRGSGNSLTGSSDSFNACSLTLSGAVTFTARVADVGSASGAARVGIMLRESTATGARFAYVGVSPGGLVEFRNRTGSGGNVTVGATATGQSLPRYLRLTVTRSSKRSTFTAYHSANGSSWTQLGSSFQISNVPSSVLGALVVCSMDNTTLHTAVFDQVSATGQTATTAPTGFTATGTPSGIDLAWVAPVAASGYRVKRATVSGGPYVTIAQPTVTGHVDEDVASNVTYYYVVSSTNSFGESVNSSEVSAVRQTVSPPDIPLKVLILGNSQALNASEAAFPPAGVADELRQILLADPALANQVITVTAADLHQSKAYTQTFTQTLSSRSLMSGYFWPLTRAATLALLAQDWDHVVMIEDPYVASRFPEYAFEGVRAIARDVRQAGGQPSLVMTWTSSTSPDASNNTARFAEMAYRVGSATGVPVIPAGDAWNNLAAGIKGSGTRPNLQGNYTTAAAIYSHITTRNAATSAHVPAGLAQTDRDAMAAAASDAVAAAPGQTHFTGSYTGPTHFAAPLLKKRSFTYTDFNSSTEWGYRAGLASVLAVARMDWTQTFAAYQSLPSAGFVYDFALTRDYLDADANKWRVFGTFDYQDDSGEESMVTGMDRVMYRAPLPEQETCAANISAARIGDGTFFVPVRVLWARLRTEHPAIPAQPDGHHLSDQYNQGVASMMFTLLTGRCGVGSEPADTASTEWKNWVCRKTGYEIAWQYATLRERVPGMEVLPASTSATAVTPGTSTTLTVRFLYPPTENVTVNVASNNPAAATVSPATLTFTPQNYHIAQTVTVTGLTGAAGSENFNATFSTTSVDPVFAGLTDEWAYTTLRPAAGSWIADASGLWTDATKWSGGVANGTGIADFSTIDITADRTVSVDTSLSVGGLVFGDAATATAAGWSINHNGNAANILTLAGSAPTISVNALGTDKAATISAVMNGTGGLTKIGPGTLALGTFNTYTGGTAVNQGILRLSTGSAIGAIRGALIINSGATVLSTAASSFGYNPGTKVDSLTINNGTLTHDPAGGTLTLSSVGITMTGGTMDSTGSAGFDFYDANALGGPNLNTSVATLASASTATIAGKINLRAGDGDATGTVFTVADGAAADDLRVSASMVNGSAQGAASLVQKSGAGRMILSGNNTYTGGTTLNGGTLVAASPTALGANSTVTFSAGSGLVLELATSDGTLSNVYNLSMGSNRFNTVQINRASSGSANYALGTLQLGASTMTFSLGPNITGGGVVRLASLDLSAGNNDRPVILNGNATLQVGNAAILSNPNISKRLQLDGMSTANTLGPIANGSGTGILSLIKAGAGRWTLTGSNTYTGTTTVQAGELVLKTATLPDSAAVTLAAGGSLSLDFPGTDIIGSLVINGVTQAAGTWGSLASGAPNRSAFITGPGTLTVLSAAYVTWANANGLGTAADVRVFSADPDGDGLANSLEWALGGSPLLSSAPVLPRLSTSGGSCAFSFNRDPASIGIVPLAVEWSADLITWNRILLGASSSGPDAAGVTVAVTPVSGAPDAVQVTVPESNAPSGRIFLRLNAGNP
jgi:glucosylceramidase